jgi:hypothetical protein
MEATNKQTAQDRRPWKIPSVKTVGTIGEVLQGGGGKLSVTLNDTGDVNKPKGQG